MILCIGCLLLTGCSDSPLDEEEFIPCASTSPDYFDPTRKTFIPPSESGFIEGICMPLTLGSNLSFYDLNADRVCVLEQHLGEISANLNEYLCDEIVVEDIDTELDAYYYQYVGLRMDEQEYIFVNAFQLEEVDTFNWIREPFIGNCRSGQRQWRVLFNLNTQEFEQFDVHLPRSVYYQSEFPYSNLGCARCITRSELVPFRLTPSDLCLLYIHLEKLADEVSVGCFSRGNMVDLNEEWLMQYMGVSEDGYRWIYINAAFRYLYAESNDNYEELQAEYEERYNGDTFIPGVCDGGLAFWGAMFDLDSYEFIDLQFNTPR